MREGRKGERGGERVNVLVESVAKREMEERVRKKINGLIKRVAKRETRERKRRSPAHVDAHAYQTAGRGEERREEKGALARRRSPRGRRSTQASGRPVTYAIEGLGRGGRHVLCPRLRAL